MDEDLKDELNYICQLANNLIGRLGEYDIPFEFCEYTLDPAVSSHFSLTGLSPSLAGLSRAVLLSLKNHKCGPNPDVHAHRFGLFRFRSPLLSESIFLSFPPAT